MPSSLYGQILRANGGLPLWRNSVTHDVPHRTTTQEWILWDVHVVEILVAHSSVPKPSPPLVVQSDSFASNSSPPSINPSNYASFSRKEQVILSFLRHKKRSGGRLIYFHIADEHGQIDEGFEELCTTFKGSGVQELREKLEEELGVNDVIVCTRSPLNGKLYPLRLLLPPNNPAMHVIVVSTSSQAGQIYENGNAAVLRKQKLSQFCSYEFDSTCFVHPASAIY
ncbi:Protein of unknown function (DUF569) [Abeliophyllum distichum]|uniref:DUF569 domain-containing protein n=1 Tax=Abeliophyllum distichum TaxID=126358 RepID=A0ABD1V5Y4_9LAMI